MPRTVMSLVILGSALVLVGRSANAQTQIQIYRSWHCGSAFCTWGSVRDMTDFDTKNHWMIDRGDGSGLPSVNLVVLSFVRPLKLLNKTNDSQTASGVPIGINSAIVSYFTSHNIRVMLSINGQTYTTYWDQALSQNASALELGECVDAVRRTGHHSSERAFGGEGIRAFDHSAEKKLAACHWWIRQCLPLGAACSRGRW